MTLILGELAAESKARWFGLGGVTAGASATCSNLVSFLSFWFLISVSHTQLHTQLTKSNSIFQSYQLMLSPMCVCVYRWSRCDCWIASATNPQMAHCTSQPHISSLWRATPITQHLPDRRSGWVVGWWLHQVYYIVNVTTINAPLVFICWKYVKKNQPKKVTLTMLSVWCEVFDSGCLYDNV